MLHFKTWKKTAGILAVAIGVAYGAAFAAPAGNIAERLDAFAARAAERKERDFGYPLNHLVNLGEFYRWLVDSGSCAVMANNAGDPFHPHGDVFGTLDFEREIVEFFGPLYGFDKNNL